MTLVQCSYDAAAAADDDDDASKCLSNDDDDAYLTDPRRSVDGAVRAGGTF